MPSHEQPPLPSWTKPIPQSRDRLQGQILVFATSLLLLIAFCLAVRGFYLDRGPSDIHFALLVALVSVVFAAFVAVLRAGTPAAALYGALLCFCITVYSMDAHRSVLSTELPPLFTLFLISFLATRVGKQHKEIRNLAESRHGRSVAQVAANLSVAGLVVSSIGYLPSFLLGVPLSKHALILISIAALAEATSDTVSSELGQVFGGRPYLLTTLRPVPIGTDGAITPLGTIFGILAATTVITAAAFSLHLSWTESAIALAASTIGLFADSLLGATFERKGYLGNDLVNFTSTLVAAISAAILAKLIL